MLRWLSVLFLGLALSACVSAEQVPIPEVHCLPMEKYSADEESAAARELQALPEDAELRQMMTDYGRMRAGNRACLERSS